VSFPPEIVSLVGDNMTDALRQRAELAVGQSRAGLPMNFDMWDGYPAARARLLGASQEAGANLIVLSGDSHNAWAFELPHGGAPAGAEFAVHSVTSPGNESSIPAAPDAVARAYVARNQQLKWAETSRRGYLTVELTPERARGEWVFMDTIRQPSLALAARHAMSVAHGTNRFASA
jgi:alkaline phosphatase D